MTRCTPEAVIAAALHRAHIGCMQPRELCRNQAGIHDGQAEAILAVLDPEWMFVSTNGGTIVKSIASQKTYIARLLERIAELEKGR